jgi:hypothetical protein
MMQLLVSKHTTTVMDEAPACRAFKQNTQMVSEIPLPKQFLFLKQNLISAAEKSRQLKQKIFGLKIMALILNVL